MVSTTSSPTRRGFVSSTAARGSSFLHPGRPADVIPRSIFTCANAFVRGIRPTDKIAEEWFGDDVPTKLMVQTQQRAVTAPATVGATAWAVEVVEHALDDLIADMGPSVAAAALLELGTRVTAPERAGVVTIPGQIMTAADAGGWVADGQPIPVTRLNVDQGVSMGLRKLASIIMVTRELATHSRFLPVIEQMIRRAIGLSLDAAMFSSNLATDTTPGGILTGATTVSAATGGTLQAVSKDVAGLINALATAGGGTRPAFIAAPAQAASLKVWGGSRFDYPVLASSALASGTVAAVDADSFVSWLSAIPEFTVSDTGAAHMDSAPSQIGTAGAMASGTTIGPWQADLISLRVVTRINWSMRAPHVAKVVSVTW